MITPEQLSEAFARNVSIIKRQTEGLSQAESLRQPPFRGNCLNWVVGHVAGGRDAILRCLGAEPVMGQAGERYMRESEPITGEGPGVLPLADLLAYLERSQAALSAALANCTEADLARDTTLGQRTVSAAEQVFFRYFHDCYHTGQTELLRQLAGKDDKII